MLIIKAKTRRNGELVELPAEELVPGDIITFEAGDKVSADGRLLTAAALDIEEAGLTGESAPVTKDTTPIAGDDAVGRPPRHGIHELDRDARAGRDGRDRDRDEHGGRADLQYAEPDREEKTP